ncbi:MAG: 4-(cytidine 5'-diphospho)-2-C-methyl-D-erythritol kinase [Coriobacteriales bacterium]|jgi:4-diphosphocytidyl-2-C-methyl-D-erythritol kinase
MSRPADREFEVIAHAKVNLCLDVSSEVVNGRHPVKTIMQTISLHDRMHALVVWDVHNPGVKIEMRNAHGLEEKPVPLEDNLIYQAIIGFQARIGRPLEDRITVTVDKCIPPRSGLGGGSSDCAAAIAFMAQLYGYEPDGPEAMDVARSLGSDIAFFLKGGCCSLEGYGDVFKERLEAPAMNIVLARPDEGSRTPEVYRMFDETDGDPSEQPWGQAHANLTSVLRPGATVEEVASALHNSLEFAACVVEPRVAFALDQMSIQPGVLRAMVSGSGSCVFGVFATPDEAQAAADAIAARGLWTRVCTTVG